MSEEERGGGEREGEEGEREEEEREIGKELEQRVWGESGRGSVGRGRRKWHMATHVFVLPIHQMFCVRRRKSSRDEGYVGTCYQGKRVCIIIEIPQVPRDHSIHCVIFIKQQSLYAQQTSVDIAYIYMYVYNRHETYI